MVLRDFLCYMTMVGRNVPASAEIQYVSASILRTRACGEWIVKPKEGNRIYMGYFRQKN